MLASYYRSRI